jgi:ABC-type amino acid transport substrate-binding protein
VLFPAQPLFTIHTDLVQNPAHPLATADIARLPRGTVIGTVLGYEYPKEVDDAQRAGTIVFEESPSESILLRKLAAGRVSGVLLDLNESKPLAYVAAQAEVVSGFQVAGRAGTMPAYIGFSAKNPRGPPARRAYDEGMRRIAVNGELAQVVRRWTDSSRTFVQTRTGPGRSGRQ